jgi:DNA-binding LytR/AlgR family response regulator
LAEIVAVQAEGNYVSLQHRSKPYLLHESLSSMAEKLKPYGFIRIHRSIVVNTSASWRSSLYRQESTGCA